MVTAQETKNTNSQGPGTPTTTEAKATNGSPEAKASSSPIQSPEDVSKLKEDVTKLEARTDGLGGLLWAAIIITSGFAISLIALLGNLLAKRFVTTQELQTELRPLNAAVAQRLTLPQLQTELESLRTTLAQRATLQELKTELGPLNAALAQLATTLQQLRAEFDSLKETLDKRPTLEQLKAELKIPVSTQRTE
jgi:chromosome segregation ATPase